LRAISDDSRKRLIEHWFDEVNFGNFYIGFEDGGQQRSIMSDKGQLMFCLDLEGVEDCSMVLDWIIGADEQTILGALNL
jgi:hypothetical protein